MKEAHDIAQAMKREVDRLAEAVTPELIAALIEGARERETVGDDLSHILASRGVEMPRHVGMRTGAGTSRVGPEAPPLHLSDGRICEKTVQLWIKRRDKVSVVLPSLTLCVGWD
jgi:hypothetical protein